MENTTYSLQYPIGPFVKKDQYLRDEIDSFLEIIERAPERYKDIAKNLTEEDLKKTYRPESWNVQQLIHHVADIQLLHFLRMKKALTEADYTEVTLINMDAWVSTADGYQAPVADSLIMLEGITRRYVYLIRSLTDKDLEVAYYHPVRKYMINQAQAIAMSAWHLQHHLAHIKIAVE
ncbi:DinB family protein [Rubrolithibacter danxiaensis]|uniref:DinB family protein n=1 Tax=Rubrolithibacter danxiaensis TaxID=3390805 RepID=UPI003BF84633